MRRNYQKKCWMIWVNQVLSSKKVKNKLLYTTHNVKSKRKWSKCLSVENQVSSLTLELQSEVNGSCRSQFTFSNVTERWILETYFVAQYQFHSAKLWFLWQKAWFRIRHIICVKNRPKFKMPWQLEKVIDLSGIYFRRQHPYNHGGSGPLNHCGPRII